MYLCSKVGDIYSFVFNCHVYPFTTLSGYTYSTDDDFKTSGTHANKMRAWLVTAGTNTISEKAADK